MPGIATFAAFRRFATFLNFPQPARITTFLTFLVPDTSSPPLEVGIPLSSPSDGIARSDGITTFFTFCTFATFAQK